MIIRRLSLKSIHGVIAGDFSFIVNLNNCCWKKIAITQIMKTLVCMMVHPLTQLTALVKARVQKYFKKSF